MRRRIAMLGAVALAAAGFAVLDTTTPATAWTLCGGTGTATVDDVGPGLTGILYPGGITTPSKTPGLMFDVLIGDGNPMYTFTFGFDPALPGGCFHPTTSPPGVDTSKSAVDPTASGVVKGYCGLSSGSGTFPANGDLFAWIGVGGLLVITGHVVGVVDAFPDVLAGESCTHNGSLAAGALGFLITGAVVLLNCFDTPTKTLETLVPNTPHDFTTLIPLITFQTLTPTFHVLVNLGLHIFWNHLCYGDPVL